LFNDATTFRVWNYEVVQLLQVGLDGDAVMTDHAVSKVLQGVVLYFVLVNLKTSISSCLFGNKKLMKKIMILITKLFCDNQPKNEPK